MNNGINFCHLHNHFDVGSPRDSVLQVKAACKKAKEFGQTALASTDHGTIDSWIQLNMFCHDKDIQIKPIFGVEMYEADKSPASATPATGEARYFHSLFLAKNKKGLVALRRLVSYAGKRENLYYKPRYDIDYLINNKDDFFGNVIWLSACINGRLPKLLSNNRDQEAKNFIDTMISVVGKENVFIELQDHGIEEEQLVLPKLISFARENDLSVVATNDTHFLEKEHFIARQIMLARERSYIIDFNGKRVDGNFSSISDDDSQLKELYLKSSEEMANLFEIIPEAIANTQVIADMIEDMDIDEKNYHYPDFPIPKDYTPETWMAKQVWDNLPKKYNLDAMTEEERKYLVERTRFEIQTIQDMNTSAYMLIDADFIVWAKERNIRVGPGRGSACGSVVAFCLGITDIEPIRYSLYFERFMNPERISMPDIDTDYMDTRREEVIKYVLNKYGADKVARIRTYGKVAARMAIRDCGAVFQGFESSFVDKIAKMIPQEPKMTLSKALKENPELGEMYETNEQCKILINHAKLIEGLVRQTGSHAAGILISDKPLTEYGSLVEEEDSNIPVFCTDMKGVEHLKLLKMDFLGLRTLTVIDETINLVKKDYGIDIDLDNLGFDDPNIYKYISSGETDCVFQLESKGMQSFMSDLQPTSIEDLILGISVYRPGPMDSIPTLVAGKKDPTSVKYPADAEKILRPILDVTYGEMVYQEQVMQIVRDLAGYTFGRSDLIRRAMAKKDSQIMESERYVFTYGEVKCPDCGGTGKNGDHKCIRCNGQGAVASKNKCPWCEGKDTSCHHCNGTGIVETKGEWTVKGCINNNISVETATELYDKMIIFSAYAFNKSHATAYAVIAYQTAVFKYYYPRQYMTAHLNSFLGMPDKLKKYIGIAKKMELNILRPNINKSSDRFIEDENGIYMGLASIKNLGKNIIDKIEERNRNGEFKSVEDFLTRCVVGKGELETLAKSGTLDNLGYNRSELVGSSKKIIEGVKKEKEIIASGQLSLFDTNTANQTVSIRVAPCKEYPLSEIYRMEKELTGFYLSGHPLNMSQYKDAVLKSTIKTIDDFDDMDNRKAVTIVGIVNYDPDKEGVRYSKAGKRYGVFHLEDLYSDIDVLCFEKALEKCADNIRNDKVVRVEGRLSVETQTTVNEDGTVNVNTIVKIFADNVLAIENDKEKTLYVKIPEELEKTVTNIVKSYPGVDRFVIYSETQKKSKLATFKTNACPSLIENLKELCGSNNVVVR